MLTTCLANGTGIIGQNGTGNPLVLVLEFVACVETLWLAVLFAQSTEDPLSVATRVVPPLSLWGWTII